MRFAEMMRLAAHGPDTYIGVGPGYPWGGLFGGQIVAQSLRAAAATVDDTYRAHSLHAYFIRRGDSDEPIRFEVDRLRNGRSFVTRAVVARQSTGAILHMAASFHLDQPARQVQTADFPAVAAPGDLTNDSWSPMFDRRMVHQGDGQAAAWFRTVDLVTDDPVLSACALAYVSDDLAADAVANRQKSVMAGTAGNEGGEWQGVSLDHAIWFQHPVTAGDWQLHEVRCDALRAPRGLAVGHVFSGGGDHVATVTQEVLLRQRRPGA